MFEDRFGVYDYFKIMMAWRNDTIISLIYMIFIDVTIQYKFLFFKTASLLVYESRF